MADLTVAIFQATSFSTLNIFARAAQADAVILLTTAQFTAKSPDSNGTKKITGMKHIRLGGCQNVEWLPLAVAKELKPLIETPLGKGNWRTHFFLRFHSATNLLRTSRNIFPP